MLTLNDVDTKSVLLFALVWLSAFGIGDEGSVPYCGFRVEHGSFADGFSFSESRNNFFRVSLLPRERIIRRVGVLKRVLSSGFGWKRHNI